MLKNVQDGHYVLPAVQKSSLLISDRFFKMYITNSQVTPIWMQKQILKK